MDIAGLVVHDVEELSYCVDPWQIDMRQMSSGKLNAEMHIARLKDIFVSDEYWSNQILGTGLTPPGHLTLGGTFRETGFSWCGRPTTDQRVAYASDSREVDFLTKDKEHHWTLLIPRKTIREYLGEDILEKLSGEQTHLEADAHLIGQLTSAIEEVCGLIKTNQIMGDPGVFEAACRARVLAAASQLLLHSTKLKFDKADLDRRSAAYIKARNFIATVDRPISVNDLVKYVGVSRRTLEIAFKEATGLSPKVFIKCANLSALHRELRKASKGSSSVTESAFKLGFTELGRTAGYYRELFDEIPSDTLGKDSTLSGTRFSEILGNNALF